MATRGLLTYWSHSRADWAEGSSRPKRSTVAGDKIVVFLQVRLPVENSDGWPEIRLAHVFTFHNGKAIHMRAFADGQQALAWAGATRLVASNYPSRRMPQIRRLEANQELARRRQGWSPFVFLGLLGSRPKLPESQIFTAAIGSGRFSTLYSLSTTFQFAFPAFFLSALLPTSWKR